MTYEHNVDEANPNRRRFFFICVGGQSLGGQGHYLAGTKVEFGGDCIPVLGNGLLGEASFKRYKLTLMKLTLLNNV
jgi:hypothetical protein